MAQNFLYMFEFVISDLLITRPNECAPDEYPTCCEFTFRSHVFVSISDEEFGGCLDAETKNGKCCLFALESPIGCEDQLFLHVYKKKVEKCKFLLGMTPIDVQTIFDKVTSDFLMENPILYQRMQCMNEDPIEAAINSKDRMGLIRDLRQETYTPTSVIEKKLLSLADLGQKQTGNTIIIMRLSCLGPQIVSKFPFPKIETCLKPPKCKKEPLRCQYAPKVNPCCAEIEQYEKDHPECNAVDECGRRDYGDCCARTCKKKEICDEGCGPPCCCDCGPPGCCDCGPPCCCDRCCCPAPEPLECPCTKTATPKQKFEEFEAELNGNAVTIRMLKDDNDCNNQSGDCSKPKSKTMCKDKKFLNSKFLKNKVGKKTCSRNCCLQVQPEDIDHLLNGKKKCKGGPGIDSCANKCVDDASTVLFKINNKGQCSDKQQQFEIALKTPPQPQRAPFKHTRDTQVDQALLDSEMKGVCKKKKGKKK